MRRSNRRYRGRRRSTQMSVRDLRQFVLREAAGLTGELEDIEDVEAIEVDAGEEADALVSDIDIYKAMQIEEARLRRQYKRMVREAKKVRRQKRIAKKRILRQLK